MPSADAELVADASDLNDWNDCSSSSSPLASLSSDGCFHTGPGGGGILDGAAITSTWAIVVIRAAVVVGCSTSRPDQRISSCVQESATGLMNTYGTLFDAT